MPRRKRSISVVEKQEVLSEERTVLSRERTVLSFMQTGLAFMGVGVVIINVFKEQPGYIVLGALLVLIGFAEVVESVRRLVRQKRMMNKVKQKEMKLGVFK
jgi:uncharacterized membrane protein YidH (DUF202 family)